MALARIILSWTQSQQAALSTGVKEVVAELVVLTKAIVGKKDIQFVILYTDDVEQTGEYHVFHRASRIVQQR